MNTIRYGATGPEVYYLQAALSRAGFSPGLLDGIFGGRTLAALTAFQRANELEPDGVAGQDTWARLYPFLAGYTVRTVQAGDTLFEIAERFGSEVAALVTANPGLDPRNIAIGTELIVPLPFPVVMEDVPYSSMLVMLILTGLAARYPFIRIREAGESVMGRPISYAVMGEGDREVFINAAHHANEWITTPLVLRFLEAYAQAYADGGRIYDILAEELFERATLILMPLVNPDGVDLVTGAIAAGTPEYDRAKALAAFYPGIAFPSGWKANIAGTDLNLGYPAEWERAREIKFAEGYTRPGPRDYVGSAPLAEPENQAVASLTRERDFALTLSYHTQGEVIYWKYMNFDPPRAEEIADAFAAASGYAKETTPYGSGFAGYKDWFIQTYDRPGDTIEAGRGTNPLPISMLPEIFRDNIGILTLSLLLA